MKGGAPAAVAVCAALAFAPAPARAAEAGYVVSAQLESRARSPLPGDVSGTAASDLELLPKVGGLLSGSGVHFELAYAPSFAFRDLFEQQTFLPLHRANAALQWTGGKTVLQLRSEAARGIADFGPLLAGEGSQTPGQVPSATTLSLVPYVRETTVLSLEQGLGSVWLRGEAGYEVSGSSENPQLPLQWGPSGLLAVRVDATPLDALTSTVLARHADFMTGQHQTLLQGTEGWARRFSRQLSAELGAGVAVVRQQLPGALGPAWAVLPVASLALTQKVPLPVSKLELLARVGLEPFADRFSATVYERVDGSAAAAWVFQEHLALGLRLSAARSFAGAAASTSPDFFVAAETSLSWTARPWLSLGAALRGSHTEVLAEGATPLNQWLASLSVTLRSQERTSW